MKSSLHYCKSKKSDEGADDFNDPVCSFCMSGGDLVSIVVLCSISWGKYQSLALVL